MKVRAPGKLVVTGAYAVLSGAPALVLAVDRHAVADGERVDGSPAPEVAAAMPVAPFVDTSAMRQGDRKLGLGSSAAAVVAALGLRAAERGERLTEEAVRSRLMHQAFEAHARAQGGGSGVDVAASTYGGALAYTMGMPPARVSLPGAIAWKAFFSGTSARTSELRARVDDLARRDPRAHRTAMLALGDASRSAIDAAAEGAAERFVLSARQTLMALIALGEAADAPIVTPAVRALAIAAESEGAALLPSGAGGGDCAIFVGKNPPSASFLAQARARSHEAVDLSLDTRGVSFAD